MKRTYLGEFDELVLLTVAVLHDTAYGVAITDELDRQTGRPEAKWKQMMLFGPIPYQIGVNAWMFIARAAIEIFIAFLTIGWQSLRAAVIDPVNSLKTE